MAFTKRTWNKTYCAICDLFRVYSVYPFVTVWTFYIVWGVGISIWLVDWLAEILTPTLNRPYTKVAIGHRVPKGEAFMF